MKSKIVGLSLSLIVICSGLASQAVVIGPDAREVQNGGSGVIVNGGYLTYYSALGNLSQPVEYDDRVPGLDLLIQEIIDMPVVSLSKMFMLKIIDIGKDRRYYRLAAKALDPKLKDKIISDYARIMNLPPEKVVLFAITTPADLSTVLMPEFYALKPAEQAAILMHEALWLRPDASINKVLTGEQITQAYFEDKKSPEKFFRFVDLLNSFAYDRTLKVRAGYYFDRVNSRLAPQILSSQKIRLVDFVGVKFAHAAFCPNEKEPDPSATASRNLYFDSRFQYNLRARSLLHAGLFDFLRDGGELRVDRQMLGCATDPKGVAELLDSAVVDLSTLLTDVDFLSILDKQGREIGRLTFN